MWEIGTFFFFALTAILPGTIRRMIFYTDIATQSKLPPCYAILPFPHVTSLQPTFPFLNQLFHTVCHDPQ